MQDLFVSLLELMFYFIFRYDFHFNFVERVMIVNFDKMKKEEDRLTNLIFAIFKSFFKYIYSM
jgi:hypothetical protein